MNNQKKEILEFIRAGKIVLVAGSQIYLDDKKINLDDLPEFVALMQKSGEISEGIKELDKAFKKEEWSMEDMQEVVEALFSAVQTIGQANK